MHWLYIGYYVNDNVFYTIQKKSINNMSVARQKFEQNLLSALPKALGSNDTIDYITYVPTDDTLEIPKYSELDDAKIYHIPINKGRPVSILQAYQTFYRYLKALGKEKLQDLRVIMYDVNPVFIFALWCIMRKYKIKITSICAEVPMMRRTRNIQAWVKHAILNAFENVFHGYVLLAEAMAEKLPCKNKPITVIEGIAPELFGKPKAGKSNIVMYAGGLAEDNNIRQLIDCCIQTEAVQELWICGCGPEQAYVEQKTKESKKIKYFGMVDNDTVRKMETQTKVLVNLRSPEVKLTRYSFPSKLLEYIASGSLVASTQLEGIPTEYFDYIVPIPATDTASLKETLTNLLSMNEEAYLQQCTNAQKFIQENKNADMQAKKIVSFVCKSFPKA